jgi:hypothetical protein
MTVRRVIELRNWKRPPDEGPKPTRGPDEYSRILGPDWQPMGDGTYRYIGKQPALAWQEEEEQPQDRREARG